MGARLLYRDSQGRDGQIALRHDAPCYVGRALDCAIRTDDAMVSRKHSMIRMENGAFLVEDLGSSNGTHVNDVRVTKQVLAHNDVVRCGSLWLRYVEDGPLSAEPAAAPAAPPRPQRGGTMRIDPVGAAAAPPVYGQGAQEPAYGQPAPAVAQHQQQPQPQPAHGAMPYGGPPPMPGVIGGHIQGSADALSTRDEDSVVVDMGELVDSDAHERLKAELKATQQRLDDIQDSYDREVADAKRLRAESQTLKDRIEELNRVIQDREEAIEAHGRVSDELRDELKEARDDLASARAEMAEMRDLVAARDRQLERAHSDINKLKQEIEDERRQLGDVSRIKDEGWKKLNEQLAEIEHLREVINEQERMLEERRIGLVSQEEVIKELRQKKDATLREMAQLRAERDELRTNESRRAAQISAIDEENRRLSQMLAELQSGGVSSGGESGEHTAKIAGELKNLRVELRTLEADRDRLQDMYDRADRDVDKLQNRAAELEVELRELSEQRDMATSAKAIAEEALAKAELARHKAAEEALEAAKARDVAMSSGDDLRRELDRAKRRIGELESGGGRDTAAQDSERLEAENVRLQAELRAARARLDELKDELEQVRAVAAAAQARSGDSTAVVGASLAQDGDDKTAVLGPGANHKAAIVDRAIEVHDSINDILSELRNNILLVQAELEEMGPERSEGSIRIIRDTISTLVGNAEDAKGVIRLLRELVEFEND